MHKQPPDILHSLDAVVRAAVEKRQALLDEKTRLDGMLLAYSMSIVSGAGELPTPPGSHYNMVDEICGCALCVDYSRRRNEVNRVSDLTTGHPRDCACRECRTAGKLQTGFRAATNRLDLLVEMSFHAVFHSHHQDQVLSWTQQELDRPDITMNWWAIEGGQAPMASWIRRCEKALSPIVSGVVFRGMGAFAMPVMTS